MKEFSIEEKAQRYDEAIERAKKWRTAPNIDKMPTYGNRIIEEIFPELKENEDERIRGNIIATIHLYYGEPLEDEAKEMIVWLERQGEQKPAWSEEDKVMLDKVIERLHKHSAGDKEYLDIYYWLIALKDRVQPQPKQEWKPSDEHIELLREVQQALLGKDCHNRFVNFMYELKRLREE